MKILYFSPVSWDWQKQRPHFLAEGFAEIGHDVIFFSRHAFGKGRTVSFSVSPHLHIRECSVLPFALKLPWIDRLNSFFLRHTIPWEQIDILFLTEPRQIQLLPLPDGFKGKIVYDCMDRIPDFFTGRIRARQMALEKELCEKADCIAVSSQHLKQALTDAYGVPHAKIHLVRNAVKDDFLTDSSGKTGELVYVGTIDSWFDWDCLIAYARKHPTRILTLVGPVRCRPENLPHNIRFIGKIPHEQVYGYLQGASLLLLPFRVNSLIQSVDPVKLYEYLSFGKNVISSYWEELDHFLPNRHLHFYHSAEEFESVAEELLSEPACGDGVPDFDFMRAHCWSARIAEYRKILEKI